MLIAIDPGMNSPGVALFFDKQLFWAGNVTIPEDYGKLEAGQRWHEVAKLIVMWINRNTKAHCEPVDVIFEKPQWYQRHKSKGNPNDLVGCAGVAANVTGLLRPNSVISPEPAAWVGQCSKVCPVCEGRKTEKRTDGKKGRGKPRICEACNNSAWGTPRGRRIHARLSGTELQRCPDQNDAIDAVGIGLWALGRFVPISVFSNGRDGR